MTSYEDLREEMIELIADEVAIGSLDAAEIKDMALDFLQEELEIDQGIQNRVANLVDTALDFHYLKQKDWGGTATDAEKLEEAFMELWERGIIAAANFACCQTCGHNEMQAWLEQDDCLDKRGYVFYHQLDARSMIRNDYLYLAYGSRSQHPADTESIAKEVVSILKKHGLDAGWSGNIRTRIHILNINWRVRRVKAIDYATD